MLRPKLSLVDRCQPELTFCYTYIFRKSFYAFWEPEIFLGPQNEDHFIPICPTTKWREDPLGCTQHFSIPSYLASLAWSFEIFYTKPFHIVSSDSIRRY